MKNLARNLTLSRFFFGLFMLLFSVLGNTFFFIAAYLLAILTDVLDGFIARRLGQASKEGGKLDIIADEFIVLCLILSFYFLKKPAFIKYFYLFSFILTCFLVLQLAGLLLKRKFVFKRTLAANIAAAMFPLVIISMLFFDTPPLVYAFLIVMIYSLAEKLFFVFDKNKDAFFFMLVSFMVFLLFLLPLKNSILCFGEKCIFLEIRKTPEERALGLMYRTHIDEDEGMLFVFDEPGGYAFWMKNMRIPIDIIFLNDRKEIITVYRDVPPCSQEICKTYSPVSPARYVVETAANFSSVHGLEIGDKVEFQG